MSSIELISKNTVVIYVDSTIYNDCVISKAIYWLSRDFLVKRESISELNKQKITLSKTNGEIDEVEFNHINKQLSQNFVDFKTREIVYQETKDLRTILFVKAFANRDDFVEFNFREKY